MSLAPFLLLAVSAFEKDPFIWEWHRSVAAGQLIEIRGVNGAVRATPSSTREVEIRATTDYSSASNLGIEVVRTATGFMFCAVASGEHHCRTSKDGIHPVVPVNFVVRIPSGVSLLARTVNGNVQAQALKSDVQAYTVNGLITVSTTGSITARAVNGSIEAALSKPFWSKPPALETVNGHIRLTLPSTSRAAIDAKTKNGSIVPAQSGTPVGGSPLLIRTINGSIEVRRTP